MSRFHDRLINRRRWDRVRMIVLDRDGGRCCSCGRFGRMEVDHRVPLHLNPQQDAHDPAGCQSLCVDCHRRKTAGENNQVAGRAAWDEDLRRLARGL